jgi:colicin import membrane protein
VWDLLRTHPGGLFLSLVLHGLIVVGAGYASLRSVPFPDAAPDVSIKAKVVDEAMIEEEMRRLEQEDRRQAQEAEAEQARIEELRRQREQAEQEARQAEERAQEEIRRQAEEAEEARRLAAEEAEKRRAAEEERQRREEAERKRLAELEEKRKAEEERLAKLEAEREAAEQRQREEAEARRKAEMEAQLKAQLAAEERRRNAERSGALAQYIALIQQSVERNWIRPPEAAPGIECELLVRQIPGGEIADVQVGACNAPPVVQRSIVNAVYKAAPLPEPADPTLFERNLRFVFQPED